MGGSENLAPAERQPDRGRQPVVEGSHLVRDFRSSPSYGYRGGLQQVVSGGQQGPVGGKGRTYNFRLRRHFPCTIGCLAKRSGYLRFPRLPLRLLHGLRSPSNDCTRSEDGGRRASPHSRADQRFGYPNQGRRLGTDHSPDTSWENLGFEHFAKNSPSESSNT